jgi:hypothetical protein
MDNKGFKTAGETKTSGAGKKVKKLLFLPAPKRKVKEVLGKKKVEQSKVGLTPSGASLPHKQDTALKQGGENLEVRKGVGVKGKKSGVVGQGSGAVGEQVGDSGKQSVSAGQHPASAGQHTPSQPAAGPPLSRGDYPASAGLRTQPQHIGAGQVQSRNKGDAEQALVRRPGQMPEVVAERIFLKKLKELSALGVRRRQEIRKERLAMILENFHLGDIITNRAVRALLGVSARTASRYLRQLCHQHKLVKFRTDRWTFYRKV